MAVMMVVLIQKVVPMVETKVSKKTTVYQKVYTSKNHHWEILWVLHSADSCLALVMEISRAIQWVQ